MVQKVYWIVHTQKTNWNGTLLACAALIVQSMCEFIDDVPTPTVAHQINRVLTSGTTIFLADPVPRLPQYLGYFARDAENI